MAQVLLDWVFSAAGVANQDGTMPAITQRATEVPGPGPTALGQRSTALRFGPRASCKANLPQTTVGPTRFALHVLFRVTAPVTSRGNLAESTALPISLFVEPGTGPDNFNVAASIANAAVGWTGPHTGNRKVFKVNDWHIASVLYDRDTLALVIDDEAVAVSAFPNGSLQAPTGDQIYVGTWVDGTRWPFTGEIAGLQLWRDIPEAFETMVNAERSVPEWYLTRKENAVRGNLNLGPRTGDFYFDPGTGSWLQPYAIATISYTELHGVAFVMYGAILHKWRSDVALRRSLGPLASDEEDGRHSGSRKSVFEKGCIYWSPQSGAVPVLERMYVDYELIGEGSSAIGLPVADSEDIHEGKTQRFQFGRMYLRKGAASAFEVHGAIYNKYETTGGPDQWGFPITNENVIRAAHEMIGAFSDFERCTILWSPRTPASIMYGAIRDTYMQQGGPRGDLGFPTSDESDIPGASGYARYNTLERGSILYLAGRTIVCRPFRFHLGALDTKEEDDGLLDYDGQNDLYCRIQISVNGGLVFDRKIPDGSGAYPSANILDLNYDVPYEIMPNSPNISAQLRVDVWESDGNDHFGGSDDLLGTFTKDLAMANAWGFAENATGLFRTADFGPWANYLDWSLKSTTGSNTPIDNWTVTNQGTAVVDAREYALAFGDVDPDFEIDFGIIDDGLKAGFYDSVVKGIASGGNCFGMSLEAIYAWKNMSRLSSPLSKYGNWHDVESDFNVKQCYQVGADAIWWFLGQFLSGNTHDPRNVFLESRAAYDQGLNPVICVAENYDFSGSKHCIRPIEWNDAGTPWRMKCFDPNCGQAKKDVVVEPMANTFEYDNGFRYGGGQWSGGRLHYMPFSVVNHRQRTPVWDAILLMLGGIVLIFADGVEVTSTTDENGNSLAASQVRNRDDLKGRLVRIPGISGSDPIKGSLYVGRQEPCNHILNPEVMRKLTASGTSFATRTAPALTRTPSVRADFPRNVLSSPPALRQPVPSDAPDNAIAGPTLATLARLAGMSIFRPTRATDLGTIRCGLRGRASGRLDVQHKRGMRCVHVTGDIAAGENMSLSFEHMSARDNVIRLQSDRPRKYDVAFTTKLGAGKDFITVKFAGLPTDAGKPTMVNAQPGAATFDVLTVGMSADAHVSANGIVNGKAVQSDFNVHLQEGARMVLSEVIGAGHVMVGAIDRLGGNGRGFHLVNRQ